MERWVTEKAKKLILGTLRAVQGGSLEVVCAERTYALGGQSADLRATILVHNDRFFRRALLGGDIGMGESYMDGDWSSPNLVSVIRLAVRNLQILEEENRSFSILSRFLNLLRHRRRPNTLEGSRRNIREHYDLSNDFFRLFLDRQMVYSCAFYETADDSLETAQINKLDRICRKLNLGPADHVLEIGTGWGAFAAHAAGHYGCRVTTTTISEEQYRHALDLAARLGDSGRRIEVLKTDYRKLSGAYDKIVSIEMFEAVGLEHYDDFFAACDRHLKRNGTMLLQTITINEQKFPSYRKSSDWIQKHIFPGSELASLVEILRSLARCTRMSLFHAEDIGAHYARTLHSWRERFLENADAVRRLGFDERFIRMWEFYLAYCEGGFLERHISDVQLLLTKNYNRLGLLGEPWGSETGESHAGTDSGAQSAVAG
ncbi:MAG: class I SAM-dependent methyltransferase [Acidobacteria bacterium]|nr:class I SAM-dependent methyltransferase [Acidobacteriota bacterium]